MAEPHDDEVVILVRACLDGNSAAWETLVDRYSRLVYSIPLRLGLSATDADDVFQNVFLLLYRNLGQIRDQQRVVSWIITTTYRESWRLGKQRAGAATAELDERLPDRETPPDATVLRWEREQLVRQGMATLDERCRQLLTALFLTAAPPAYDELAGQLRMPVGSIGPTRARCFKKLERALEQLGFDAASLT